MLVEGLLLWSKVVSVNISEDRRMKLYYIIGWGKLNILQMNFTFYLDLQVIQFAKFNQELEYLLTGYSRIPKTDQPPSDN